MWKRWTQSPSNGYLHLDVAFFSVVVGLFLMPCGMAIYLGSFRSDPHEALIFRTVACVTTSLGAVIVYRAQAGFEYTRGDDVRNLTISLVRLAPRAVYAETYYIALIIFIILFITDKVCGPVCTSTLWFWHFRAVWSVAVVVAAIRFYLTH